MAWLTANWFWVLIFIAFIAMHLLGASQRERILKKAFIVASISWLCLFVLLSPNSFYPASARFRIAQAKKATEPDAATQRDANLNSLYEAHQWFKLREGVQTTDASAFYRGVVATAFNDVTKAEKEFQLVFKSAPKSEEAFEAHVWLIYLYQRAGRFRQAVAQIDEILKVKPDRADLRNARALFAAFGQYPEQVVAERRLSSVRYSVKDGNLFIPVSVNSRSCGLVAATVPFCNLVTVEKEKEDE